MALKVKVGLIGPLDMLKFKSWYYEQAMRDGNEDRVHAMLPDRLPPDIQPIYDHAHET